MGSESQIRMGKFFYSLLIIKKHLILGKYDKSMHITVPKGIGEGVHLTRPPKSANALECLLSLT